MRAKPRCGSSPTDVCSVAQSMRHSPDHTRHIYSKEITIRGAVLYAPEDVRLEPRDDPKIIEPTDAIIRMSATCVCGSDLWDYRGINPVTQSTRWAMSTAASSRRSAATSG
jgi:hypothetical protein